MGYYGGTGGRLVWDITGVPGQPQPQCQLAGGVNMVDCGDWTCR